VLQTTFVSYARDDSDAATKLVSDLRIDDCRPSRLKLNDLQWVDMFPDWNEGLSRLLRSIGV
jgi:hypothetical protein